jgi:hypothetical protein
VSYDDRYQPSAPMSGGYSSAPGSGYGQSAPGGGYASRSGGYDDPPSRDRWAAENARTPRGGIAEPEPEPEIPSFKVKPAVPTKIAELGIPASMLHDLILRQALFDGRTSTVDLSKKLAIGPLLMSTMVEELRELRYLEVQGLEGHNYLLALTDAGRAQATDRMQLCRYTGPAPVSLESYTETIRLQKAHVKINLAGLQEAFKDLVISEELLREVGPASIAGGAMFLYGPPGTGKTSIAERLLRVYDDHVLVPHTVAVDGQIIQVFDPVVHRPSPVQPKDIDPRWVLCQRPFIIVGGELTGSKLDLAYQVGSGVYLPSIQMQANNGILVIDDFGRQTLTPAELLNRWIVPLDRQVDYLSLDYGLKFEVPFDSKIVFSTNLEPTTLGDEAFFRRIQSKILIPTITDDQFEEVLRRVAQAMQVELSPDAGTHLRWMSRELGDGDLRPYLPGAVCKILISICEFEDLPLRLDPTMIERIAHMYFTHAPERYGEEEEGPVSSVVVDSAPQLFGKAPAATSMFGGKPAAATSTENGINRSTASWTDVAAKAVAALKAEEGAEDDGEGDGSPGAAGGDTDPTAPVESNA